MPQGKKVLLGLNQNGVILFVILLLFTGPCFCWVPWFIDSMKGETD